jgi:acyl carrier protein
MPDITDDVVEIIAKKVVPPRPAPDLHQSLDELGLNSLALVELVMDIEDKFDIEIPYNANSSFADFKTVGDLVSAIQKLVAAKA